MKIAFRHATVALCLMAGAAQASTVLDKAPLYEFGLVTSFAGYIDRAGVSEDGSYAERLTFSINVPGGLGARILWEGPSESTLSSPSMKLFDAAGELRAEGWLETYNTGCTPNGGEMVCWSQSVMNMVPSVGAGDYSLVLTGTLNAAGEHPNISYRVDVASAIPESSTAALMLLGLGGVMAAARRRR